MSNILPSTFLTPFKYFPLFACSFSVAFFLQLQLEMDLELMNVLLSACSPGVFSLRLHLMSLDRTSTQRWLVWTIQEQQKVVPQKLYVWSNFQKGHQQIVPRFPHRPNMLSKFLHAPDMWPEKTASSRKEGGNFGHNMSLKKWQKHRSAWATPNTVPFHDSAAESVCEKIVSFQDGRWTENICLAGFHPSIACSDKNPVHAHHASANLCRCPHVIAFLPLDLALESASGSLCL